MNVCAHGMAGAAGLKCTYELGRNESERSVNVMEYCPSFYIFTLLPVRSQLFLSTLLSVDLNASHCVIYLFHSLQSTDFPHPINLYSQTQMYMSSFRWNFKVDDFSSFSSSFHQIPDSLPKLPYSFPPFY